jgi:hypothetical protein
LAWQVKYGDKLEWFQELEDEGEEIPAMSERVEIFPDLAMYYRAFTLLSTSRQMSMGLGYISYLTVTDYLNEERIIYGYERDEYRRWIRKIDGIYVSLQNKKNESGKPKNSSKK